MVNQKKEKLITQEYLKERLTYDPETGIFVWKFIPITNRKNKICNTRFAGKTAGTFTTLNYKVITIDKKRYLCHRLAWLYMTGNWPINIIDHIDGDTSNNKFDNLREVTSSQNQQNRSVSCHNVSGVKGVRYCKKARKWRSNIGVNKKWVYLGLFESVNEAVSARKIAEQKYYGKFARES